MSVETISPAADPRRQARAARARRSGAAMRPVVGALADGTPFYAAAESGQPPSWLRRQAAACGLIAAARPRG